MIVYKIRRRSDRMFSTGGRIPNFTKTGKYWKQRGHLTNHLRHVYDNSWSNNAYNNCDVVEIEVIEKEVRAQPLINYLSETEERIRQRETEKRQRWEEYLKTQRFKEYKKLKCEFEGKDCK